MSLPFGLIPIHGLSDQLLVESVSGVDQVAPWSVLFEKTIWLQFIHVANTVWVEATEIVGSHCPLTLVHAQSGCSGNQLVPPSLDTRTIICGLGHELLPH